MTDVLDILELDRDGGSQDKRTAIKKKRLPENVFKKPEGMNREVFALLYADSKDSAPLIPSDYAISSKFGIPDFGYKKAKANLSLRKVRKWCWIGFTNPSRKDGFKLNHWRREVDRNKEYPFAKMNVVANVPSYTDTEYRDLLQSESWSRAETDYLLRMCKKYDLRFIVIEDRWDRSTYNSRTVEDIKDRYYSLCNILTKHRNEPTRTEMNPMGLANMKQQICVFDAEHERKRKEQLIKLYNRTSEEVEEEQQLIAELRKIEQRKKEREKKTQDLQKLITAADTTSEQRRQEQQIHSRSSTTLSRSNRKKTQSQVKGSRVSDIGTASMTPYSETANIKFPELKGSTTILRSSRMKLPNSVGQKRTKAIHQLLNELNIEQHPPASEEISTNFNELRSDMVLIYELKYGLSSLEFELQTIKHQGEAPSALIERPPPTPITPMSAPVVFPRTPLSTPAAASSSSQVVKEEKPRMSENLDVNITTHRKRKTAIESENLWRKIGKPKH